MRKTIGVLALSLILLAPARLALSQEFDYRPSEAAYRKAQKRMTVIERNNPRIRNFFNKRPAMRQGFVLIVELVFERDETFQRQQRRFAELIQKQDEWKIARDAE